VAGVEIRMGPEREMPPVGEEKQRTPERGRTEEKEK
jgi:hypothetical protein